MTYKTAAIVALIGGLAVAGGSFLPWASVTSGLGTISLDGMRGDGMFSLALGGIVAFVALLNLEKPGPASGLIALGGALAALLAGFEIINVNERIGQMESGLIPSIGAGLFVILAGGIAALVGGTQMGNLKKAPPDSFDRT